MPVKVRCGSCQKVLNAPDRARGKSIKCPNCAKPVRVPSGDGKQSRRGKAPAKPRKSSAPDVADALANLDLRHAEDRRVQVCPKCGAEVNEEDLDCAACGIDLATGEVSIRTLRKKGLAAADPTEFYSRAWSDSARFVMDNKKLVFQTGVNWTLLIMLLGGCLAVFAVLHNLKLPEEPSHIEETLGAKWPLKIFFVIMAFLFMAGAMGWYWRLAIEVIRITMVKKKKKIPKVNFDFFEALALGCKVFFWSYIFMLPIYFVVGLVLVPMSIVGSFVLPASLTGMLIVLIALGLFSIPLLVLPVAMVHMTARYTYKAWLPTEMIKVWAKNIGPALYWLMIFVVVNLPIIGILVGMAFLVPYLETFFFKTTQSWALWILAQVWEAGSNSGFVFNCVWIPIATFFAALIVAPICILAAIPAVFTMRANGLLAFYRKGSLELIYEKNVHEKAGFWVRYLAFLVDYLLLPLTSILVYKSRIGMLVIWAHNASLIMFLFFLSDQFILYFWLTAPLLNGWMYFATSEGSPEQGTIGKHAFGMIVLSEKRMKQLTLKQASMRYFAKILAGIPFGLGFVFVAFTKKKQGLHDLMTKTIVVFKGDDDATTS